MAAHICLSCRRSRKLDKQRKAPPRVWGGSPIQNQSFAQRATISNTLVLLSGVWGTPHLKQARSTSAKQKNISDALPLLFFCFASTSAQPHQRNKIRLHGCLCILILLRSEPSFQVLGRKARVDIRRTKVAWLDCVPIKGRFLMR